MQQLSGLDQAFLALEGRATPLHVTSLIVLDGATLPDGFSYEAVRDQVEARTRGIRQFRQVLHDVPFGLDHPYWRIDDSFDIEFHVRHSAVPSPGSDRALSDVVARLHARPLDRSRPLWEMYVIDGLAGGDVGLLTKMHHAAIDGVGGIELAGVLLDTRPDAGLDALPELAPERAPSTIGMLARSVRGVTRIPARTARSVTDAVRQLPAIGGLAQLALPDPVRRRVRGDGGLVEGPRLQAPPTPFNTPVTPHRRVSWTVLPLSRVKAVKNARGTTLNDVVMAITAGAVRGHLLDVGGLPDRPLQAMVPISVRSGENGGNRVTAMVGLVPTHLADPVERLDWVHGQMRAAKDNDAVPADVLMDVTSIAPPVLAARAARVAARLRWADTLRLPFNMIISNVPGPRVPLYVAGARMKHMIPVSAIHDGLAFNVTIISHEDDIDVGLVADREVVADLWHVAELFDKALDELASALGV